MRRGPTLRELGGRGLPILDLIGGRTRGGLQFNRRSHVNNIQNLALIAQEVFGSLPLSWGLDPEVPSWNLLGVLGLGIRVRTVIGQHYLCPARFLLGRRRYVL